MPNTVQLNIPPRQILFSAAAFVQGASLLTSYFVGVTKQTSWLAVIAAYILSAGLLLIYLFLLSKHPGKGLIEINSAVYGRFAGKLISLLFLFYFFTNITLNTSELSGFIINYMMPETPPIAIAAPLLFVCILGARKGIDCILRLGAFFSISQLFVTAAFFVLLIPNMELHNMLPLFDISLKDFFQSVHTIVSLPFCGLIVFTMFLPSVTNQAKVKGAYLGGLSIGSFVSLMIVVVDTAVLGPLLGYFSIPRFESTRLINIADVITRMDTIYGLVLVILRVFRASIILYVTALALSQIFGLRSYKPLVSAIGMLAAFYSLFAFRSSAESAEWGINTAGIYLSFFNVFLPLLTLLVYFIRAFVHKLRTRTA